MTALRSLAAAAAALIAAAAPGCGLGPGERSQGEATLTVTRDYGSARMLEATVEDPPSGQTVMRLLDREAAIETRYGGGFVQSIDGLSGGAEGGRRHDWFFYVNGIESPLGAAEVSVRGGDRVWWDRRDWSEAMRVPAVVGSWPEPFVHGFEGERYPVRVACERAPAPCKEVSATLRAEGARLGGGGRALRVLVGPWRALRDDRVAGRVAGGPGESGVFGRFERRPGRGLALVVLDQRASEVERLGPGAGLVAATGVGDQPPTWVVTGTDSRALVPSLRAASATAWAWLPALAATTPAASSSEPSRPILWKAPLTLNEPVSCRHSAFSVTFAPARRDSSPDESTGVTRT